MKYDVFGIGSALMDFLVEVEDEELLEFNLKKGQFHLIDEEDSKKLLKRIEKHPIKTSPGGSCANTLCGVAIFGGNPVFCGKIGRNSYGDIYEEKMLRSGVKPRLARSEKITGRAITFITPDRERTFAVYLGAALELKKADIFLEDLKKSKILHIEGYQLEDKGLRDVSLEAMQFAKKHKIKISIDLGDPGIVARNKADIKKIIEEYADIVFANEAEARALVGLEPLEAQDTPSLFPLPHRERIEVRGNIEIPIPLNDIAKLTEIAIVKVGRYGSYIKQGNTVYKIPGYKAKVVDTTGAGDMFAAGVLYGICSGYDLKICGHIGSYFAAKVVEGIGARLEHIDQKEVENLIRKIDNEAYNKRDE